MKANKDHMAVLTVVGEDRVGIIAGVTRLLADYQVNVEDISQTITHGIFNMFMLVSLEKMSTSFETLKKALTELGSELSVNIAIQHRDIFTVMHRI